MFNLPSAVEIAINSLNSAGYEAYIVGGCVRDFLLQKTPSDYDIATSATPLETEKVFEGERIIETGLKHGTVTLIKNGMPLEITTYRIDGKYHDNRRPEDVTFTKSLEEDLARRDFTVNAMAYSKKTGVVDIFGGRSDLKNKIIRCVGNADRRFKEDALRIMRALRFASVLGFEIEKDTKKSIFDNRFLLKNISAERISAELSKLLCGENVKDVILEFSEVLEIVLPEIRGMKGFEQKNPHHIYDVLTHTAVATQNAPKETALRLAIFFHDCGKPDTFKLDEKGVGHFHGHPIKSCEKARRAMGRLKFDNATTDLVLTLVKYHDTAIEPTEKGVKKALNKYSPQVFFKLLDIKRADNSAKNPKCNNKSEIDLLEKLAKDILSNGECFSLKDLAVKGKDIINLGVPVGKEIGNCLDFLLRAVINNEVQNQKENLINFLKEKKLKH